MPKDKTLILKSLRSFWAFLSDERVKVTCSFGDFEEVGITPDPGPVPPALPAHRYHSSRHVADAGDKDQEKHAICRICSAYFTRAAV